MATIFNATEYLALYPELAKFGLNADNVYTAHYVPYGAGELRAPNNALAGKVYPASVLAYANGNPELAEYFGITVPATQLTQQQQADLVLHYVNYGNAEDRANKLVDAPVEEPEVPVTDLVEAIVALQNAEAAAEDTLKAAAETLNVDATLTAIETAETAAIAALEAEVPGFAAATTPSLQNALLTAKEQQLNANVELAKLGLTPQEQARVIQFEKAKSGLESAAEQMAAANSQAALAATQATLANATALGTSAAIAFDAATDKITVEGDNLNGKVTITFDPVTKKAGVVSDATAPLDQAADEVAVKSLIGYKDLVAALTAVHNQEAALDAAVTAVNTAGANIAALGEAGDNTYNAIAADATAVTDVKAASFDAAGAAKIVALVDLATYGGDLSGKASALQSVQEALEAFEEAKADYVEASAELAKVTAAQTAATEAKDYLEDEFGVTLQVVSATNDVVTADRVDDLFVYAAGEDTFEATVFGFNQFSEDSFFFGSQFTWTVLAADADIEKAGNGDRDVLEIFAQQQGSDLVLYVETDEAGGTVLGMDHINTITLAGVNIDSVEFASGFLTGVTAA